MSNAECPMPSDSDITSKFWKALKSDSFIMLGSARERGSDSQPVVRPEPARQTQIRRASGQLPAERPGIADIEHLARWLDAQFVVPGTGLRFGFDALLGLLPGIGDGASALIGLYIIARARALGAPPRLIARMLVNLFADTVLGAVPLVGDVFDVAFRANLKNVQLLLKHLET